MKTTLPFTVLVLTLGLAAQTVTPPSATSTLGGAGRDFPFSYTGYVRYQQAIDQSYLSVGTIYGISFRSRTTTLAVPERQWQGMKVTLGDLPVANVTGMSGTFAANLGTNQLEVFNGRLNLYRPNPSDPLEFSVTIPFEKPFLFIAAAPLVVDLQPTGYEGFPQCGSGGNGTAMDGSNDVGIYSTLGKGSCTTPPTGSKAAGAGGFVIQFHYAPILMPFGKGCPGSNGKIPKIGSQGSALLGGSFSFTLEDAPANSQTSVFVTGLSNTQDNLARLPLDLSFLTKATGCWQNAAADIVAFLPVAGGKAALPVTIPNNQAIKGVEIFSQFAVDDPTLGSLTVTQGGVIRPQ